MDRKRIELIITGILIIILLFATAGALKARRKNTVSKDAAKRQLTSVKKAVADDNLTRRSEVSRLIQQKTTWEGADWGRCPFSGISLSANKDFGGLNLAGILWDEQKPSAIINDKIVVKGDEIGNYTVVDIKKDKVVLSDGSGDFELGLTNTEAK